jgi:hypothetical protein
MKEDLEKEVKLMKVMISLFFPLLQTGAWKISVHSQAEV